MPQIANLPSEVSPATARLIEQVKALTEQTKQSIANVREARRLVELDATLPRSRSLGDAFRSGDVFCAMCGRYLAAGIACQVCRNTNDDQEG